MKQRRRSMVGDMISMGVGNIVGVGLIGATASAVGSLPAGTDATTKTIAGLAPAMQSTALLGHNIGYAKRSFGKKVKFL